MPEGETRPDEALVEAANRGDAAAFETLYLRYRDWVVALAWRFTGNRDDALDVLQDTFADLLRRISGFRLSASMKTFLYTVVRNRATDLRRKRHPDADSDAMELVPAPPVPPDAAAQRRELAETLAALPENQREILLMRFADDMSVAEIAGALCVPVGTVKSRLHAAVEAVRRRRG